MSNERHCELADVCGSYSEGKPVCVGLGDSCECDRVPLCEGSVKVGCEVVYGGKDE